MLQDFWNGIYNSFKLLFIEKGRGGCAGMEIRSANKLWAMQSLCSKCNFLWHAGGKMMLWWCQGLSADKNTVLELNTKFCFMNTLIRNNWFRLRAFLFFFLHPPSELLTFPLCMETRWVDIFQKHCYQLFQCHFVSFKKEFFPFLLEKTCPGCL